MPLSAIIGVAISKAFAHLASLENTSAGAVSFPDGYSNNWVVPAMAVTLSVIVTQAMGIPYVFQLYVAETRGRAADQRGFDGLE